MQAQRKMDAPETVKILETRTETPTVSTLVLDRKVAAGYGQFFMVWIPGEGERPYAASRQKGNMEITVRQVGKFSRALAALKAGDRIGIRGPYGKGQFSVSGDRLCFVAGGLGIVPLMPLIESEEIRGKECSVILGAKNGEELLFTDRIKETGADLCITTDDGSIGFKGFCHERLLLLLREKKFDQILCCGPEVMMKAVMDIALKEGIKCQLSLERYMKCGIGICGSCALDPTGLLVCRDGPVFDAETLRDTEFGNYRRDSSGSKINI